MTILVAEKETVQYDLVGQKNELQNNGVMYKALCITYGDERMKFLRQKNAKRPNKYKKKNNAAINIAFITQQDEIEMKFM
jgi:hypothetical protein